MFHLTLRFYCIGGLWHWFEDRPDVLVAGNSFVYYDHVAKDGQVEARRICPDVFVVFGVPNHRQDRGSYVVWDEGPAPAFVLDIASDSTRGWNKGTERHVYAEIGVSEYFLLDERKPRKRKFGRSRHSCKRCVNLRRPTPNGTTPCHRRR